MILVVGATGQLGQRVCERLLERGTAVRGLTRTPANATALLDAGVHVVRGDLRDPESLEAALRGCDGVIACAHGLADTIDPKRDNPRTVDDEGNRNLIEAAVAAGVRGFVFISVLGASPDSPTAFLRAKALTEKRLISSGLHYTIIRPSAFIETWARMIGEPVMRGKKAMVFGSGENPVSLVSLEDVSRLAVEAVFSEELQDRVVDLGGPKDYTLVQVAETCGRFCGKQAQYTKTPVPVMRAMSAVMAAFKPEVSRLMGMGAWMATSCQTCVNEPDIANLLAPQKTLEEFAAEQAAQTYA